jgi:hypothetical protein
MSIGARRIPIYHFHKQFIFIGENYEN